MGNRRGDGKERRAHWGPLLCLAGALTLSTSARAAAEQLADAVSALATANGFAVVGLGNLGATPAPPAEGSVRDRLERLLQDFDHVTIEKADGSVERVVIGRRQSAATQAAAAVPPRPAAAPAAATGVLPSPVDHAVLTSGFGLRRDPLRGGPDVHTGIDLAAPAGTPVHAPAPGVIVAMGWRGGYGLYLRLRHDTTYETAYGHLSRIAPELAPGAAVTAGETIGFVGVTGRTTGPHLHYEILVHGVPVDPASMSAPSHPAAIRPAAIESDLRRALVPALLGHRIDAALDRLETGSARQ
jgi:murein DD-endopeptidase MepM/ murein hydrolase activator NlpD